MLSFLPNRAYDYQDRNDLKLEIIEAFLPPLSGNAKNAPHQSTKTFFPGHPSARRIILRLLDYYFIAISVLVELGNIRLWRFDIAC